MADVRWIGGAAAVAQVDDITPGGTIEAGDIFILTVTGENADTTTVTFTATATTVANVTAGLTAAWNASTHYLCTPITAADVTTKLTLTADSAGVPFYVAATTTEAGGGAADDQTIVRSSGTANSGPYDFATALNWDTGVVPGASALQSIIIEGATILYGLNRTAAAEAPYYVEINDSQISQNPSRGRDPAYLYWDDAANIVINNYYGPGSPTYASPMFIKTTVSTPTITVYNTGTNSDTDLPAVWLYTTDANAIINVLSGKVGIGYEEKYAAGNVNVATLNVSSGAYVYIGTATTTTINNNGGTVVRNNSGEYMATYRQTGGTFSGYGAATTTIISGGTYDAIHDSDTSSCVFTVNSGSVTIKDGGAYTGLMDSLILNGGYVYYNAGGTVTLATVLGGTLDMTACAKTNTITTLKLDAPGVFKYNPAQTTLTNKIQPSSTNKVITYAAA
jgi:hypothetical protein